MPLTGINFQFSLWDSSQIRASLAKRSNSFNSLCEIPKPIRPQGTWAGAFQFSLWDSFVRELWWSPSSSAFNSLCEIQSVREDFHVLAEENFQFSLWDSFWRTSHPYTFLGSFNSLCEILSLLFRIRFRWPYLSILFVRFLSVGCGGCPIGLFTFNSLCEIP